MNEIKKRTQGKKGKKPKRPNQMIGLPKETQSDLEKIYGKDVDDFLDDSDWDMESLAPPSIQMTRQNSFAQFDNRLKGLEKVYL